MRFISESFKKFLKEDREIKILLDSIKGDSSLDCEIRKDKLQVYYRGSELFSIVEKGNKFYFSKSPNSAIEKEDIEITQDSIQKQLNCVIPEWKNKIDLINKNGPLGPEREAQQLIVRENNLYTLAEKTDYYIVDIEDAHSSIGLRFDMLAVKTLQNGKDRSTPPKNFAIIELKFSNGSVKNKDASLEAHFSDLDKFLEDGSKLPELKEQIRYLFNLKLELSLIKKPNVSSDFIITEELASKEKPEYIIILANYNVNELKQNSKLHDLLIKIKQEYQYVFKAFDVKFATSAFMGYGLYADYMIPFDEFIGRISKKQVLTDKQFIKQFSTLNNTWHYGEKRIEVNKTEFKNIYNHGKYEKFENLPGEEWKSLSNVKGYTHYWVSSLGRVRINDIIIEQDDYNNSGYLKLDPYNKYPGRVDHEVNVYTLIAMGFLGKEYNDGYDVHHLDNNGYNCKPENLRLLTRKQHIAVHSKFSQEELKKYLSEE